MGATNARDQLEATLGDGYRVERELGGGGMSRVFVARELALDRDVVVKVLAPALAEGVSAERFAREIRLAARLQEPHIVPVLAAGATADGLPFYIMPFVRGESLRARLEQAKPEGRVPVAEAVGILRDIATALEYAHAHGVVHRDIKPENVLLSGRTAVVTDFGIAKALQASKTEATGGMAGGSTLTQVGTSIGTPAYMAPEQAAGDSRVDHRADVYAWGVIAYELLAGRHPFAGKASQQQLLAAHILEAPPPLDVGAGAVPSALAALVGRCLAKDPAERPATAAAVLAALDAARDDAVRDDAVRDTAARSRGTLARVFAVYAAAVVAVALLARAIIDAVGLPDWVLPGALIVMALGLPVLLVTGFVHHLAHPQAHPRAPYASRSTTAEFAVRARPHLTWGRAAWGGAGALGLFALIVAGYMALRALGIGPAGSLLAAGVLHEREPLLVADFRVTGPDTALGPVVAEAVRTNLGQSRAVSMVPASQVVAALQRMQRPAGGHLDLALAREVAEREGVRAVVGGELTPLGGGYLVTLRLVTAATGDVLASFQATAKGPTDLIPALDRLTRALRGKIGESLKAVRADPPLERVTTPSLDALRNYTAARHAGNVGDWRQAAALAREAIVLDSTFAMAWRLVGTALSNARFNEALRDSAFAKAYAYRDRLTERERLLATATYFHLGSLQDRRRAVEAYEALLARDSGDIVALNNLSGLHIRLREFARAESLLQRGLAAQPRVLSIYNNLQDAQVGLGKLAAAESTAALALARFPEVDRAPWASVSVAAQTPRFDSAVARAERWRAAARTPEMRAIATEFLVLLARTRGRPAEAARRTGEMRALRAEAGDFPPALIDGIDAARDDLWLRGQPARAVARLDALVAARPIASLTTGDDRADVLTAAAVYAAAGRPERARALVAAFDVAADSADRWMAAARREEALAEIALAEGRAAEALAHFRRSDVAADGGSVGMCAVCVLPGLARAAERAGLADSARVFWTRFATEPAVDRMFADRWHLARAYRRLGELHAEVGDQARAAEYDRQFLALWRDADPELRPQLAAVRRHLAHLEQSEQGTPAAPSR